MSIDKEPLSPILIRFQQDIQLNGLKERTQQSYVRNVRKFSEFLKRDPDSASEDDLRRYLLYIKNDAHWSSSTINVAQQALKRFFTLTCPQTWATLKLVRARGELKLPVVISISEVHTLLKLIEKPSMFCFFTVVYSLGLRLQEALNLHVKDIDSKRMLVHIHRGKGAKDRLVPLPESTLQVLREYYKTHRNKNWIFPTEGKNHSQAPTAENPMSEVAISNSRIVKVEPGVDGTGMVTFTYRPSGTSSYKPMRVSTEEFIRRFLQHVLPSGFQKVRHFGFAHPRAKTQWEWLSMLVTVTLNMVYVLTVTAKPLVEKPTLRCPECDGDLTCLGFVASTPRRLTEFDTS